MIATVKGKGKGKAAASSAFRLLSADRDQLLEAVAFASGVVGSRSTLPILYCVRLTLDAAGTALVIEATNLDQYVESRVPVEDLTDGFDRLEINVAIPAKLFHSALGRSRKGAVAMTFRDGEVILSGFTITTLDGREMPACPFVDFDAEELPIDAGALARAARFVAEAKTSRYVIMGVYIQGSRIVASDGRRGYLEKIEDWIPGKRNAYVSPEFAAQVAKMQDPVLMIGDGVIRARGAESGQPTITAKQMSEGNPDTIISGISGFLSVPAGAVAVSVSMDDLTEALRSASLMVEAEHPAVTMQAQGGVLMLTSRASARGSFATEIPMSNELDPAASVRVSMALPLLLSSLPAFQDLAGDIITLQIVNDSDGPRLWVKTASREFIQMGMRLND